MPDQPPAQEAPQGLLATASRFLTVLVSAAETRVDLLATELQEEGARIGRSLLVGAAALFCLGLGVVLLAIFFAVLFWDTNRLAVLGLLSGLFLGLGLVFAVALAFVARGRKRPLRETSEVLAKDRQSLEQTK
jgi:uncharacterized membrane protein YqjE